MGRNVSEGGGSMSGAAEDDGSGGSVRKLSEDFRRWRFDVLQSRFQQVGGGHAYHQGDARKGYD